jgi:hypothetical protein
LVFLFFWGGARTWGTRPYVTEYECAQSTWASLI